jgi:hypothetical protein
MCVRKISYSCGHSASTELTAQVSHYGHKMTADLVNAYIDLQLCEMERRSPLKPGAVDKMRIEDRYPVAEIPKACCAHSNDSHL